jgi:hypothetical protein
MKNNKTKNNVNLESLNDVQELINDILTEIKDGKRMSENSGKIVQLLQCWLRCYEMSELEDLEWRIRILEGNEEADME